MTLAVFSFGNQEIRTATDEHGEIWFVAADVCAALDLPNTTRALERLDQDEQALISIQGISRGNDEVNIVNESGLYALIFGSRKEAAKRFKRWVTSEVLPAIRKNGYYASNESTSLQQPAAAETVDAVMRVVGGMAQNLRLDTDDYLMLLRYSLGKYDQKLAEIVPQELLTARASIPMDAQWGVDTSFDLAGLLEDFGSVFLDVDSFLHRMMVCGVVAERTVYDEQTQSLIHQKRLQNTYFGVNCGSGRNAIIGWYRDRFRQALALATNVR